MHSKLKKEKEKFEMTKSWNIFSVFRVPNIAFLSKAAPLFEDFAEQLQKLNFENGTNRTKVMAPKQKISQSLKRVIQNLSLKRVIFYKNSCQKILEKDVFFQRLLSLEMVYIKARSKHMC